MTSYIIDEILNPSGFEKFVEGGGGGGLNSFLKRALNPNFLNLTKNREKFCL